MTYYRKKTIELSKDDGKSLGQILFGKNRGDGL